MIYDTCLLNTENAPNAWNYWYFLIKCRKASVSKDYFSISVCKVVEWYNWFLHHSSFIYVTSASHFLHWALILNGTRCRCFMDFWSKNLHLFLIFFVKSILFACDFLRSCSGLLLEEKLCKDHLKKMRSQEIEALQKSALVKNLVRKCNTMAVKAVICPRCGYMNGWNLLLLT